MELDALTPETVRAWTDAVGPTALIAIVLLVVVLPMWRRERKDGASHIDLREIAEIKLKVEMLWAERNK